MKKLKDPFYGKEISCAVCDKCYEELDNGRPTGKCYQGGPYTGYVKVKYEHR